MKKLLVTAIGAAAAFGASAGLISTQRFETASLGATGISSLNTLAGGNYWSGDELTNTYEIVSCAGEGFEPEEMPLGTPTKALSMKTTFGSPLKLDAIAGGSSTNIPASGLYFDSLVKFTVCEEEPEQTYDGAKIIMWLQEQTDGNDNITGTNIMVRANYINADETFTATNFVCGSFSGSIDKWQRVTIKTWANILNGGAVPGFAIFINGEVIGSTSGPTMADVIKANLTEAPAHLSGNESVVFASLDQDAVLGTKGNISSVSFDGTGKLTDLVFTDEAPFTAAEDYVAPKAYVTVGGLQRQFGTLAEAIAAVNDVASGNVQFRLAKDMSLTEPIEFACGANLVLDFAGFVLTNNSASAAAISNDGYLTITNSTGNGGIYCTSTGPAISDTGKGAFAITGGNFWGHVALAEGEDDYAGRISGGAFMDVDDFEAFPACLPSGKKFASTASLETGLYEVVNKVNYTVKFISGEGSATNEYTEVEGTQVTVPIPAVVLGKTFSAWNPAIAGATVTVSADATYTAQYTINEYSVKFVYGLNKEYTNTVIGVTYGTVPTLPANPDPAYAVEGYNITWPTFVAVTADATYEASYAANTYTVTFYTNSVAYTTATYTYGDASTYTPPADPSVDGYTFGGWYTDNGTFESGFTFSANVAGDTQVAYAKLTSSGPAPIDPSSETPQTIVTADSQANAIAAATITPPAGVDAAAYKQNFDFSATSNGDGTYTVTMTGIKESVEQTAAASAEAILTGDGSTVTVPAGLYYKVTTYTALGGVAVTTQSSQSDGTGVSVTKPGTTQGFIKVQMATVPFN